MRHVKVTLTPGGVDNAIAELKKYEEWINRKSEELVRRLGELGLEIAKTNFSQAQYAGNNDVYVSLETKGDKHVAVVARGNATWFIEFGTGVTFADNHPKASEFGAIRGTYGYGHGANPKGWSYVGVVGENPPAGTEEKATKDGRPYVHTKGNPANMPMYLAEETLRQRVGEIAREVFAND